MDKLLQTPVFLCYVVAAVNLGMLMLIGWCLTKLYDLKGWPEESEWGNCWSHAVPLFLRDPEETALVVSKSRHAPVPHARFAWSIGAVSEFVPKRPQRGLRGVLSSFWFRGMVKG